MAKVRVAGVEVVTVLSPRLRVAGVSVTTTATPSTRLRVAGVSFTGSPKPQIQSLTINAGEREPFTVATITATLSPGSPTPDSWTISQTSGPAVSLVGAGPSWTFELPAVMPPNGAQLWFTVVAALVGGGSSSMSAATSVLPCTQWVRAADGSWVGSKFVV